MIGIEHSLQFSRAFLRVLQPIQAKFVKGALPVLFPANDSQHTANTMAKLLEFAFSRYYSDPVLFAEDFEMLDDVGNLTYYHGRFLIRTKENRGMNVWFGFAQDFDPKSKRSLYDKLKRVTVRTLSDEDAERAEHNLFGADLIIRFKNIETMQELFTETNVDVAQLLLDGKLQVYGNLNHLFRLGAIFEKLQRLVYNSLGLTSDMLKMGAE
jgi:hypothetical protein